MTAAHRFPPASPMSEERLLRSVRRLSAALSRLERQAAASRGVSVSQMRILMALHPVGDGGVRVSDMAGDQGLAISTMTRNFALLERQGLVQRADDDADGRAVRVVLTEAGRALAQALNETTVAKFARAFRVFHPSDRIERAVALDRVAAALEQIDDGQ
ncbi:MAG: winged helix-turn-helix transcriptional regulator [Deltaproteobacteria bacterium]|nr:winged helix-turn-helix transcriptional regulator [Deltaproteobacteria bacterium]